jgi:hypothetical protein
MTDITDALLAPATQMEPMCWQAALADARSVLADLAVRGACAGPFRITEHDVRVALRHDTAEPGPETAFAWTARTARRALGLAAIRLLLGGRSRSPLEAVRARMCESARWVHDGSACASQLDRWVAGLTDAGRAAVEAEAVTWATRLWCALDWAAFDTPPVIGRDRWWDSPHSALLALRGRAEVRTTGAHLVVLSGPRRDSVRSELALVALVEALRSRSPVAPGRVVGWWPESGHIVRLEAEPTVLYLATEAVTLVLTGGGASGPVRAAA